MIALLRRKDFDLLWLGGIVSSVGDWVLLVALPYYVYDKTGSTLAAGLMFMASTLPRLLFGAWIGVLVDRWDRRRLMIAADLARAAVLLLLLVVPSGAVWLFVAYLVRFLEATLTQGFGFAKQALLPEWMEPGELVSANSLVVFGNGLTRFASPTLGGVLLVAWRLQGVVLTDVASFVCSAAMLGLTQGPVTAPHAAQRARLSTKDDWLTGLRTARSDRLLWAVLVSLATVMVGYGIITVLLLVYAVQMLHGNAATYAWLLSAQGLGSLVGGLALAQVGGRADSARLFVGGLAWTGLVLLATFQASEIVAAMALMVTAGVAMSVWTISEITLLQRRVQNLHLGRVLSVFGASNALFLLIGMGLGSLMGRSAFWGAALDVAGALYIAAGVIGARMLRRKFCASAENPSVPG